MESLESENTERASVQWRVSTASQNIFKTRSRSLILHYFVIFSLKTFILTAKNSIILVLKLLYIFERQKNKEKLKSRVFFQS